MRCRPPKKDEKGCPKGEHRFKFRSVPVIHEADNTANTAADDKA